MWEIQQDKVSSTNTWKEKKKKTTKEKKKDEGFPIKRYYQTNAMYGPYLDLDSNNTTEKRHLIQTGKLQ